MTSGSFGSSGCRGSSSLEWLYRGSCPADAMAMDLMELHLDICGSLRAKYSDLPRLKSVLESLRREHQQLIQDGSEALVKMHEMREAVCALEKTIEHVETSSAEAEYLRDSRDYLNRYHELKTRLNEAKSDADAATDSKSEAESDLKAESSESNKEVLPDSPQESVADLADQLARLTTEFKERFRPDLVGGGAAAARTRAAAKSRRQKETYRRINHCREYLRQIQGKSRGYIPPVLIERVRQEMKKRQIAEWELQPSKTREILKRIRQAKYYEHVIHITAMINKCFQPLDIPVERIEILCARFMDIERPFNRVRAAVNRNRKNFLSYPYVIYKLCELMGWDEYLADLKLLQPDLLIPQDKWWRLICRQLNWEFIRTVGSIRWSK